RTRPGLLPAHAGINRAADAVQSGATAPPRVRGHQPSKAVREKLRDATSPHTHAGINPDPLFRPPPAPPPPRIRGDKPNCWETRRQVMDTFPHTRGSTGDSLGGDFHYPLLPAHAGINRSHRR